MTTYSAAKVSLDEIAKAIQYNALQLDSCLATATTAELNLGAMPSKYGTVINDIQTAAAAAPGDQALQHLKFEKDKLVAEFQALLVKATATRTAIENVD